MTRRITSHLFHSLDGIVESPDQWQFGCFGPEEGELMGRTLALVTDIVIGRKLWDEWSAYWQAPGSADDPFAQFINPVRKHVVSTTRSGDLGWNSTVIGGDPVTYVRAMRDSDDPGDVAVVGGIDTVRSLFLAGAIDALTLTTHPVIAGQGRRLFDSAAPGTRLTLLDSQITGVGNAILTYALRERP
jgi:RNA polymerase sigma-70 factor (ECF subfamily)